MAPAVAAGHVVVFKKILYNTPMNKSPFGKGVMFTASAFTLWGILPLYWHYLDAIDPLHLLALRIAGSLLLVGVILALQKNSAWLAVFKDRKKCALMILTAIMISANWGLYIWAIAREHTIDASLGYYINPLLTIVLGMIFFREKLKPLQWAAFGMAAVGVLILTILTKSFPWIAISLAMTFGIYGLLKKNVSLSALESLGAETLASLPVGLFILFFRFEGTGSGIPRIVSGWQELANFSALPVHTWIILAFCGAVTAFPLYCFARGTKLLPLSTVGFLQFISPTIQFLLGLLVFHEPFPKHNFIAFTFIWAAVIIYIISLKTVPKGETPDV
jgi:chloramphenicol-sensitive protein RarD